MKFHVLIPQPDGIAAVLPRRLRPNVYVVAIARPKEPGDPFRAVAWTSDALQARRFGYNLARAVANRNGGILATA